MLHRSVAVLCFAVMFSSSDAGAGHEPPVPGPKVASKVQVAQLSDDDRQVLEASLLSLARDGMMLFRKEKDRTVILLQPESWKSEKRAHVDMIGSGGGFEPPLELRDALHNRNLDRYSFTGISFGKGIRVQSVDARGQWLGDFAFIKETPDALGYAYAMLPGYSKDGKWALVYMGIGPSGHGATGSFLFKRSKNRWKIEKRHFAYFG